MLVLHDSTCPALCQNKSCYHVLPHAHTCHAPTGEELAELVEAASNASNAADLCFDDQNRLDAALEPFTKENQ